VDPKSRILTLDNSGIIEHKISLRFLIYRSLQDAVLSPWTRLMAFDQGNTNPGHNFQGISASGDARQHNGNVYNSESTLNPKAITDTSA